MENKFINRYNTFCRCLENLKKSQKADPEADFVLEGTVQNFNFNLLNRYRPPLQWLSAETDSLSCL